MGRCQGFSSFFTVSNVVKQGGILFRTFFNMYMDDLSINLNKLQIGCLYAGTLINRLMYADDLCSFSPSVAGLRTLTDFCAKYGELSNITYNANNPYCMVIDMVRTWKIFIVSISVFIHYLILPNVNILVI